MCNGREATCSFTLVASTTYGFTNYTLSGLTIGNYYQLKVSALNIVGYGVLSQSITFVAANVPNRPNAPIKVTQWSNST